VRTCPVV